MISCRGKNFGSFRGGPVCHELRRRPLGIYAYDMRIERKGGASGGGRKSNRKIKTPKAAQRNGRGKGRILKRRYIVNLRIQLKGMGN